MDCISLWYNSESDHVEIGVSRTPALLLVDGVKQLPKKASGKATMPRHNLVSSGNRTSPSVVSLLRRPRHNHV